MINNILIENWIFDLKKKEISNYDRALLIHQYITENKISMREFSRLFSIPKSTVEDWLLWLKIDNKKIKELNKMGFSKTDIYKTLRENKNKEKDLFLTESILDYHLWKCYIKLKPYTEDFVFPSNKTKDLVIELKKIIISLENKYIK